MLEGNYTNRTMTHPTKVGTLAGSILQNQVELTAWQRKFLLHLFQFYLGLEGRHNFINTARYGDFVESTYRNNFVKLPMHPQLPPAPASAPTKLK